MKDIQQVNEINCVYDSTEQIALSHLTSPPSYRILRVRLHHCTFEIEGTFKLCVDKLNRVIVPSRFFKTLGHV